MRKTTDNKNAGKKMNSLTSGERRKDKYQRNGKSRGGKKHDNNNENTKTGKERKASTSG